MPTACCGGGGGGGHMDVCSPENRARTSGEGCGARTVEVSGPGSWAAGARGPSPAAVPARREDCAIPCAGGSGRICNVCEVKLPAAAALAQHRASTLHQVRLAKALSDPQALDIVFVRSTRQMAIVAHLHAFRWRFCVCSCILGNSCCNATDFRDLLLVAILRNVLKLFVESGMNALLFFMFSDHHDLLLQVLCSQVRTRSSCVHCQGNKHRGGAGEAAGAANGGGGRGGGGGGAGSPRGAGPRGAAPPGGDAALPHLAGRPFPGICMSACFSAASPFLPACRLGCKTCCQIDEACSWQVSLLH